MDPSSGVISSTGPLDRLAIPSYQLYVVANDGDQPSRNSTPVIVTITVSDVNNYAPYFLSDLYEASVYEDQPSTQLVTVLAFDQDSGSNANIKYSITAGNIGNVFAIDPIAGIVTTISSLDREATSFYSLSITATDGGSSPLSDTATVEITVNDINDNSPVWSKTLVSSYSVLENFTLGATVGSISATDADAGTNALLM